MPPLLDSDFCWAHDKENEAAASDARRIGGLRRRREATLAGAYDLIGLDSVEGFRRFLAIPLVDSLNLDNGIPRNRTLVAIAMAGLKALEVGELADRLAAVEGVLARQGEGPALFSAADAHDEEEAG